MYFCFRSALLFSKISLYCLDFGVVKVILFSLETQNIHLLQNICTFNSYYRHTLESNHLRINLSLQSMVQYYHLSTLFFFFCVCVCVCLCVRACLSVCNESFFPGSCFEINKSTGIFKYICSCFKIDPHIYCEFSP